MTYVTQEVKDLYHLLEHEFLPLDLASEVQPLLAKISKVGGKISSASSLDINNVIEAELGEKLLASIPKSPNQSIPTSMVMKASQLEALNSSETGDKQLTLLQKVEKTINVGKEFFTLTSGIIARAGSGKRVGKEIKGVSYVSGGLCLGFQPSHCPIGSRHNCSIFRDGQAGKEESTCYKLRGNGIVAYNYILFL
ncbi:hypothetical protein AgCh_027663 [Apium graveolens]